MCEREGSFPVSLLKCSQYWEIRIGSYSPTWVAKTKQMIHHCYLSVCAQAGNCNEKPQQDSNTGTPICIVNIPSGVFTAMPKANSTNLQILIDVLMEQLPVILL